MSSTSTSLFRSLIAQFLKRMWRSPKFQTQRVVLLLLTRIILLNFPAFQDGLSPLFIIHHVTTFVEHDYVSRVLVRDHHTVMSSLELLSLFFSLSPVLFLLLLYFTTSCTPCSACFSFPVHELFYFLRHYLSTHSEWILLRACLLLLLLALLELPRLQVLPVPFVLGGELVDLQLAAVQ